VEQATGLIMATVFLFSGQPDYTTLHPAEVTRFVDDGVTILKDLPSDESDQFISHAWEGQHNAAGLTPNEQRVFELDWGGDAPRYYLAQEAPDLYRRIELADREGYSVSLTATGDAPERTVQVEATRKALVAGTYDTALGAFVGKPTLVKTVCTTSATVRPGRNTVVIWTPPAGPVAPEPVQPPNIAAGQVPPWAIGRWHVEAGGDATVMEMRADGTVVFSDWPHTPIPAEIGADGAVRADWVPEGETERVFVVGRLKPDGTGRGVIAGVTKQDHSLWTAVRLGPQGAAEPITPALADVPAWTIGKWRIELGDGNSTEMEVFANGTVVSEEWPNTPIAARISAAGQIQLDFVPEGEAFGILARGRLSPDGTGSGTFTAGDGPEAEQGQWTATRLVLSPRATRAPSLPGAEVPAQAQPPTFGTGAKTAPAPPAVAEAPDMPGIAIVLKAQPPGPGASANPIPDAPGLANVQIEISTVWVELAVGSPEWNELMVADDKAQFLRQLVDDKRVKVVNQPRLLVPNNHRGEIAIAVSVPPVVLPVVPPGAADTPPANRIALTNALCVTPRLLADGTVAMGVETRFEHLGGWVTGPRGEVVPIVTYQATNSQLVAAEGQAAVMSALSSGAAQVDPEGQPLTQGTQTLILLTPRVVKRGALAARPAATAVAEEQQAQLATCRSNVKQLCQAAHLYAQDHEGTLPTENWPDQLLPYCKGPGAYICPAVPDLDVGYALNPAVAGLSLSDIKRPANLVLFFEADLVEGRPPNDAQEVLTAPRHGEKIVVGLVDGHVETVDLDELRKLLERDPFE
jgi:hypothetical protein